MIYFGGLTPLGVRIRSQMEKLGINAVVRGHSGIMSDAFIEGAGQRARGRLALASSKARRSRNCPAASSSRASTTQPKYNEAPEAYGPFAFARPDLIMDAIEKVGPDRKKVRDVLRKTKDCDSIVGKITFDDHGQNIVAADHQVRGRRTASGWSGRTANTPPASAS